MQALNLPAIDPAIKYKDGKAYIRDVTRKKYILLTPEEWVRQHFLHLLMDHKGYPKGLIRTEMGLRYNQLAKRSDILVFNKQGAPLMLVECKAPEVKINQQVFEQAAMYNKTLQAAYLVVTNGLEHYCCFYKNMDTQPAFVDDIPAYVDI